MSDVVPAYVSYLPHLLKQTYMYIWGIHVHVYYINNYYTMYNNFNKKFRIT